VGDQQKCTYQRKLGCGSLDTQVQGWSGKAQAVVLNPDIHTAPQPGCTSGQTSQTAWHLAGGWCRWLFDHLGPVTSTVRCTGSRRSCPDHWKKNNLIRHSGQSTVAEFGVSSANLQVL